MSFAAYIIHTVGMDKSTVQRGLEAALKAIADPEKVATIGVARDVANGALSTLQDPYR